MARAPFAICACNMDTFETVFRIVKVLGKIYGCGQIGFIGRLSHTLVHGKLIKKPLYGFGVVDLKCFLFVNKITQKD